MGVEQINLDEILVRTEHMLGEMDDKIFGSLDPSLGAVVVREILKRMVLFIVLLLVIFTYLEIIGMG